jgi:hypothetical protein
MIHDLWFCRPNIVIYMHVVTVCVSNQKIQKMCCYWHSPPCFPHPQQISLQISVFCLIEKWLLLTVTPSGSFLLGMMHMIYSYDLAKNWQTKLFVAWNLEFVGVTKWECYFYSRKHSPEIYVTHSSTHGHRNMYKKETYTVYIMSYHSHDLGTVQRKRRIVKREEVTIQLI